LHNCEVTMQYFRSSRSTRSSLSSRGDVRLAKAPPAVSVQPPTPTSSGHTLVERSDFLQHSSSESSKSTLEYSSDSTLGGGRVVKEDESFLEESEDTLSRLSTTTSGSDTLADSGESEDEKKSAQDSGGFKNPFSVDGLFGTSREKSNSFSSSSSSGSSVVTSKIVIDQKSVEKLSSSSETSSDDLSSSSSSSEEMTADPPRKLVKQFSSTVPLNVNLESVKIVAQSDLVSADVTITEDPTEGSAMVCVLFFEFYLSCTRNYANKTDPQAQFTADFCSIAHFFFVSFYF